MTKTSGRPTRLSAVVLPVLALVLSGATSACSQSHNSTTGGSSMTAAGGAAHSGTEGPSTAESPAATGPGTTEPGGSRPGDAEPGGAEASGAEATGAPLVSAAGPGDLDADLPSPLPYPSWDDAARRDAEQIAVAAMTTFARPSVDEVTWWSQLQPYLTANARVAYQGTDPAAVPAAVVTGPGRLVEEGSAYLAGVDVDTDAGTYRVLLAREGAGSPWLVERLVPPPSLQAPPSTAGGGP